MSTETVINDQALPTADRRVGLQFLPENSRVRTITLAWPFTHEGRTYREITLARLTAAEVVAFQRSLKGAPEDAAIYWPIFRDSDGGRVPSAVLDNLDDDDKFTLDEAAASFLPRRFLGALTNDTAPPAGGLTA